jgi:hypothetical protein
MPIFGITASSNMTTKLTDFFQIATTTVGSGGAADITFSSIPVDYTHLQIRILSKGTDSSLRNIAFRFNSDTGSNYSEHYLLGDGASASSGGVANISQVPLGVIPGSSSSAFSVNIIDILDYANTNKYKTAKSLQGLDVNGVGGTVRLRSGNWRSTSAINSITIFPDLGNFAQYSSFQLYGVKA